MKVYFEAGANNGVIESRTHKYKDDENWIGILVEPDPRCHDALITTRGNNRTYIFPCALVPDESIKEVDMLIHSTPLMNMVTGSARANEQGNGLNTQKIPARTIQNILDELDIDTINEMYIDVEGYETEVLKGIDPKTNILFLEVERHYHDKSEREWEEESIKQQADRLGLTFSSIETNIGHPKFEFVKR